MIGPAENTDLIGPYITSAASIAVFQTWLKTQSFYVEFVKAFPGADKWAHWTIAGVASLIAAAGIHLVWTYDPLKGGTFSGTIPDIMTIVHGVSDWFRVYIFQHVIYKATRTAPATSSTVLAPDLNLTVVNTAKDSL